MFLFCDQLRVRVISPWMSPAAVGQEDEEKNAAQHPETRAAYLLVLHPQFHKNQTTFFPKHQEEDSVVRG